MSWFETAKSPSCATRSTIASETVVVGVNPKLGVGLHLANSTYSLNIAVTSRCMSGAAV